MQTIASSIPWRIPCALFAAMFFWSAAMQWNDPDPALWIAVYVILGTNAALALFRIKVSPLAWSALALSALGCAWLTPSIIELFSAHPAADLFTGMSPDRPYVEEAREGLGLLIGVLASVYVIWLGWRKPVT